MRLSVVIVCVFIFACVDARVGQYSPEQLKNNPKLKWSKIVRHTRDLNGLEWDGQFQGEDIFSSTNQELLEARGYNQHVFDNHAQLDGQEYVPRSLWADDFGGLTDLLQT
ncbi:uncharacterized protein LOC135083398 [Ostrinia nubilalis]|uniref:uncharacterized protein LOC135083398 n=1 Tax=Ostrinia nubilalis TaxID=29057 RepID=UPI0030823D82